MLGFNGGLVGLERLATSAALGATGLWLPNEQSVAKRANKWPAGPNEVPAIGAAFQGGFFAGYISHTANGVPTHAIIVAPRATGASGTGYTITTNRSVKPAGTSTLNTSSLFDGRANTDAMIVAGIAAHPAAQFCVNLNIGGFTDWYLPAIAEVRIAYVNLKPSTDSNDTSSGVNAYSVPARATPYTSGVPSMTSVAAFNSTGGERFTTNDHWSSTQSGGGGDGMLVRFSSGLDIIINKGFDRSVRAFRRVPV